METKKLVLSIELENAAFDYPYYENELKRIFNDLSERVGYLTERNPLVIRDINGNVVGQCEIIND